MYKVSVIVPIYGVEQFIARCADTLLSQTMEDIEYVFVNDATKDNSMKVLEDTIGRFPHRIKDIVILHHQQNKGLPAARNTGLAVARGEYILHCDSDDFVEKDMLEKMYSAAVQNQADIVWCDWYLSFDKKERYMKQPGFTSAKDAMGAMLEGAMKYNVWNKLAKAELYKNNGITFPSGYGMGEDLTMIRLFAVAENVCYIPQAFYHYVRLNSNAFSQTYSQKHLDELKHNVDSTISFLEERLDNSSSELIARFKLNAKFPFLTAGTRDKYDLWQEWFPEANSHICTNTSCSLRSKLLQWSAWKKQYWFVRLYYIFVHRVIYGIIYR